LDTPAEYLNLLIWPMLRAKLERVTWSFVAAMIVLAAAQRAAVIAEPACEHEQGLETDRPA